MFCPCPRWVSKKRSLDGGWQGGVSSIQFFLDFLELFNFAKPLRAIITVTVRESFTKETRAMIELAAAGMKELI